MQLQNFQNSPDWVVASVALMAGICENNAAPRLAISGGKTPGPIYSAFSKYVANMPGVSIECYQVDERYVTPDHPESNQRLIAENLLDAMLEDDFDPPIHVHFFNTHMPLAEAIAEYEKDIRKIQFKGGFDLCVLGLGLDGHTASLFPHSAALHETNRLVAHTQTDQFPVHDRLTLTFPAIMASKKILLLAKGREKKQILDDLLHSDKSIDELPAKKLLAHAHLTIHYCTT